MKSIESIDSQIATLKEQKKPLQKRADFLKIKSKCDRFVLGIYKSGSSCVSFSDFYGGSEFDIELDPKQTEFIKDTIIKTVMDKLNQEVEA